MSKESKHTRKEILEVSGIGDIVSQLKKLNAAAKIDKMQEIEMAKNAPALLAATEGMGSVQDAFVDSAEDFRRRFIASAAASSFSDIRKGQGWMGRDIKSGRDGDVEESKEEEDSKKFPNEVFNSILRVLNDQYEWWKKLTKKRNLDTVEQEREKGGLLQSLGGGKLSDGADGNKFLMLGGIAAIGTAIAWFSGGLVSVGLAFAGLRGWEIPVLKWIGKLSGTAAAWMKEGFMGKIMMSMKNFFAPLIKFSSSITTFMKSSKVFMWLKSFGGVFGTIFKKILWPIGVLLSVWDGITSYRNSTESSTFLKFGDGIAGMLGSFIGAPFDLLKKGIIWLIGKLFGIKSKDGKYDETTGMGSILNAGKEFSIIKLVKRMIKSPFVMIATAYRWISDLFTNPVAVLSKLWKGLVGEGGWIKMFWTPIAMVVAWVHKKFGWRDEDAPDFNLLQFIKDTWDIVVQKVMQGFIDFGKWIALIPVRLKVSAMETINEYADWLINDDTLRGAQEQLKLRQKEIQGTKRDSTITNNVGAMNSGNNSNNQVINTTINGGVNEAFGNLATSLGAPAIAM